MAVFEEADVLDSELNRPGTSVGRWHGIFTNSEQEEESDYNKVGSCPHQLGSLGGEATDRRLRNGLDWEGQLRPWRGVGVSQGFGGVSEGQVQFFRVSSSSWVLVTGQHEGLAYVTEGGFDRLRLNLFSAAKATRTDSGSEVEEELLLFWFCEGLDVRVLDFDHGTVAEPPCPAGISGFVVHRCSGKRLPRSVEITLQYCLCPG